MKKLTLIVTAILFLSSVSITSAQQDCAALPGALPFLSPLASGLGCINSPDRHPVPSYAAGLNSTYYRSISGFGSARLAKLNALDTDSLRKISLLSREEIFRLTDFDAETLKKLAALNSVELEKLANLDMARRQNLSRLNTSEIAEKLDRLQIIAVPERELFRNDVRDSTNEDYASLEVDYSKLKDMLELEKTRLNLATTEEDFTAEVMHAKEIFTGLIDLSILDVEKTKALLSRYDDNAETSYLLKRLDYDISFLQSIKSEIINAKTQEEVNAAGLNVADEGIRVGDEIHLASLYMLKEQVSDLQNKAQYLEMKVDNSLIDAEVGGSDTTSLRNDIMQYSVKVENARALLEQADGEIRPLIMGTEYRDDLSGTRNKIDAAYSDLKESHLQIIKIIRETGRYGKSSIFDTSGTYKEVVS